ncbi:MAG: ATP synthase F0 subunit B [Planctomycetota bacterium]|jgi:F-type H+-transporting ATPase subunit b
MPDWAWTLIAQLINVAILVVLLRRFLYQPVRKMLATRRARIQKELEEASASREDAESLRKSYEERLKQAEAEAETIEAAAKDKARLHVEAAEGKAKEAAEGERRKVLEALEGEMREAEQALKGRTVQTALAMAEKLLESAAGPPLASALALELVERVRSLEADELPPPSGTEERERPTVRLRVSHDPGAATVEAVRRAFADRLEREVGIEVEIAPDLFCGVEAEWKSLVVKSHLRQRLQEAKAALETGDPHGEHPAHS